MTDKQISKAAIAHSNKIIHINSLVGDDAKLCKQVAIPAFKAGVEWALDNQWISVEDALPDYGENVLVYDTKRNTFDKVIRTLNENENRDKNDFYNGILRDINEASHWMRIPKPRKEETE